MLGWSRLKNTPSALGEKERAQKQTGFTIVELLIVVVVIAILAAITIVSYNGVSQRTKDTARINAISDIRKGLELYRVQHGKYPGATNSGVTSADDIYPGGGWEISSIAGANWLDDLRPFMSKIPTDPVNDSSYYLYYYYYENNSSMCGADRPNCYVLGISKLDVMNPLEQGGIYIGSGDAWRSTTSARPVWRGAY